MSSLTNLDLLRLFPKVHYRNRLNAYDFFQPLQALQSEHSSALFLKKLITVALCNFFKLRGVFPENSFITFQNRDFDANVLDAGKVPAKQRNAAFYVIQRLIGFFDAIDRRWGKELHVRILSRGNDTSDDRIELLTFCIQYGSKPIIKLAVNGTAVSKIELDKAGEALVQSFNNLLENIFNMGIILPQLTRASKPHITIWMKKTDDCPAQYVAPYFPPGPLYGLVRYPPMDSIYFDGICTSNDVTTGFHTSQVKYSYAEGDFGSCELFQRYYDSKQDKRRQRNRVVEVDN